VISLSIGTFNIYSERFRSKNLVNHRAVCYNEKKFALTNEGAMYMLSREDIFSAAAKLPGTVMDSPFEENFDTVVLRHGIGGKWYGLVFKAPCQKIGLNRDGEADIVNFKCDPVVSYGLIESYDAVIPAYHMNKYHWISIVLEKGVPTDVLEMLMSMSYDLTKPKVKKRRNKEPQK